MARIAASGVSVGDELPTLDVHVTRGDLVRYAGASGDFNQIHWSDRVAAEVGLPGVIAHGMLTMALATRMVSAWAGDPSAVVECAVRFSKPVVVPDDADGALVTVTGVVKECDSGTAKVAITATFDGRSVLGGASAIVALA